MDAEYLLKGCTGNLKVQKLENILVWSAEDEVPVPIYCHVILQEVTWDEGEIQGEFDAGGLSGTVTGMGTGTGTGTVGHMDEVCRLGMADWRCIRTYLRRCDLVHYAGCWTP